MIRIRNAFPIHTAAFNFTCAASVVKDLEDLDVDPTARQWRDNIRPLIDIARQMDRLCATIHREVVVRSRDEKVRESEFGTPFVDQMIDSLTSLLEQSARAAEAVASDPEARDDAGFLNAAE